MTRPITHPEANALLEIITQILLGDDLEAEFINDTSVARLWVAEDNSTFEVRCNPGWDVGFNGWHAVWDWKTWGEPIGEVTGDLRRFDHDLLRLLMRFSN